MADNVLASGGALVVATKEDAKGIQHQEMVQEFLTNGDQPMNVGVASPMPVESPALTELLTAILIEQRITNQLLSALVQTETEPIEMLRAAFKDLPVTL